MRTGYPSANTARILPSFYRPSKGRASRRTCCVTCPGFTALHLQEVDRMYSIVLMMPLSNGAAAPSLDATAPDTGVTYGNHSHQLYRHKRGGGCCGCSGGGHGGCYGGGYGCHG